MAKSGRTWVRKDSPGTGPYPTHHRNRPPLRACGRLPKMHVKILRLAQSHAKKQRRVVETTLLRIARHKKMTTINRPRSNRSNKSARSNRSNRSARSDRSEKLRNRKRKKNRTKKRKMTVKISIRHYTLSWTDHYNIHF